MAIPLLFEHDDDLAVITVPLLHNELFHERENSMPGWTVFEVSNMMLQNAIRASG